MPSAGARTGAIDDPLLGVVGEVRSSNHTRSPRISDGCRGVCLQVPSFGDFYDPGSELGIDRRYLVRTSGSAPGSGDQDARKADLVARLVDDRLEVSKVPGVPFKEGQLAHNLVLPHRPPRLRDQA